MSIDLNIQTGPCAVCGATNYPMSMGGPRICPTCDCGVPPTKQLKQLRKERDQLQSQLDAARADLCAMREALQELLIRYKAHDDAEWGDCLEESSELKKAAYKARNVLSQPNPGQAWLKEKLGPTIELMMRIKYYTFEEIKKEAARLQSLTEGKG